MSNTPDGNLIDFVTDDYFRYEEEMDKVGEINRRRFMNASTHYYIPPQEDTLFRCRSAIDKIQKILVPTMEQQNHDSTKVEIAQRLHRFVVPYVNEYNKCLERALDYHDYNKCGNKLVLSFENDTLEFAKSLAKEY